MCVCEAEAERDNQGERGNKDRHRRECGRKIGFREKELKSDIFVAFIC